MASGLQCGTSEETAASSQALTQTCGSMWNGWTTQTSSADACAPTISQGELHVQGLGVQVKSSTSYQTDLLSSWLSGFQSLSQEASVLGVVDHDQPPTEDGTSVYPDEFSRLDICSTASDRHVGHSESSHAPQLLDRFKSQDHEFFQTPVRDERNRSEESARYLHSLGGPNQSKRSSEKDQHMVQTPATDLTSKKSSLPTIQISSFGHMMQQLVGQYENNSGNTWLSCVSTSSSHLQPSDSQLRPFQGDPTCTNTSCSESVILHHRDHRRGDSVPNADDPYCTASAENMYAELHGLITKTQQDPLPRTRQLEEVPASSSGNCDVGWAQFSEGTSMQGQESIFNPDGRTTSIPAKPITNRLEDRSSSNAGKSKSTVLKPGRANPEWQEKRSSRRLEDELGSTPAVKRPCIENSVWQRNAAFLERVSEPKLQWQTSLGSGFGTGASSGLDMHSSVGPALNTNGKPRARRGSATDPQSVYARHRRERITERLKILQHLVPNGQKVDIVTMLEEAINYVKFLQLQVRLLSSDEYWIYAPTTYNGVDVSMGMHFQGMDSQA